LKGSEVIIMLTLILEGGAPMLFVILFGLVALSSAAFAAYRPSSERIAFSTWAMLATLFSVLGGIAAALAAVFHALGDGGKFPYETKILLTGLGESMSAGVLGFPLLALTAFFIGIALRRNVKPARA
jgi:hypothetical protein